MPSQLDRTSQRVVYASRAGVPSIANLASPQSGPDGTAALQAVLNLNSSGGSLKVVIDIPVLAANLKVYSGTTVEGIRPGSGATPSTGLWMRPVTNGTDSYILGNAHFASNLGSGSLNCANIVDQDISIRNLYLNGMRGNGASGNSDARYNSSGYYLNPIKLYGITNARIDNVYIYDPCTYGIHVSNCNIGYFDNLTAIDPIWLNGTNTLHRNTTAIQFLGPCNDLHLGDVTGWGSDDGVAFNAADGNLVTPATATQGPQAYISLAAAYYGNIVRVTARNLHFGAALSAVRVLVGADPRVGGYGPCTADQIIVSNVTGNVCGGVCHLQSLAGIGTGTKGRIALVNFAMTPLVVSGVNASDGYNLGGAITDLVIRNHRWLDLPAASGSNPHQINPQSDAVIGRLELDGYAIREDSSEQSTPGVPVLITQGTIDELVVRGSGWFRNAATALPFISVTGGTINSLQSIGNSFDNVANVLSFTGGTISNITSNALTHRNAGSGNASYAMGSAVPQFTAGCSNTAKLLSGTAPTSKQTDGTERS